ncbi:MAG: type I methionyl aminopeptidase [Gemmatimonas sp.]
MTIQSATELEGMRAIGKLVAQTLERMEAAVKPGVTTAQLDNVARAFLESNGARSAPQLTYGFPGFTCISVNEEIVHGVPGARMLREGDVVTLDVTAEYKGFMADAARTVALAGATPEVQELIASAKRAYEAGVRAARPGKRVRNIGRAIEESVRNDGFSVMRELCGHGIGRKLHEEPTVPNFDDPAASMTLHEGLVIAVEPLVSMRPARIHDEADGWTIRTHNRAWSAHHENTIVVMDGEAIELTVAA